VIGTVHHALFTPLFSSHISLFIHSMVLVNSAGFSKQCWSQTHSKPSTCYPQYQIRQTVSARYPQYRIRLPIPTWCPLLYIQTRLPPRRPREAPGLPSSLLDVPWNCSFNLKLFGRSVLVWISNSYSWIRAKEPTIWTSFERCKRMADLISSLSPPKKRVTNKCHHWSCCTIENPMR
jgi:hypothetical protein